MSSSRDTRDIVARPVWGTLRQGTIFAGAVADGYEACEVHGLIITARCDLRHDKVPLVNYLPVVPYQDWMRRDYARALADRASRDLNSTIRDLLRSEGHAPSVLEVMPLPDVIRTFFPPTLAGKSKARAEKAKAVGEALAACDRCSTSACADPADLTLVEALRPSLAQALRMECLSNELSAYHFLPLVEPDADHSGFVVLLRQVYHLTRDVALRVSEGVDLPIEGTLLRATAGFAAPLGEIRSPYLEHLMQRFALLYSRIGVSDISQDYALRLSQIG